ncbi:MAG TPA: hypothetical protein PKK95_12305 [Vicinamibacterales bacterium]|nr:hypothetical protein [Acidobacteriota bacterium]HOC19049.1 hypothetical protein [Vicinamibacterales bacterium]
MPNADELMELARGCVDALDLSDRREVPSLADVEDQCEEQYGELLDTLNEDEIFGAVDLERQQQILDTLESAAGEDKRELVRELADQHTRHVWLMQEAAFHVGLALGLRMAGGRSQ